VPELIPVDSVTRVAQAPELVAAAPPK
jgi:hypothetical protein